MQFDRARLSDNQLITLYRQLVFPRLIEEKMLILLRQGKISKWFSGIGQEAIAVGLTQALADTDYILPLHRNLGVFTSRGVGLERLICQWLGKPDGFTQGRDRSFHFAVPEKRIVGMISHLGAMLPVADGLALVARLDQQDTIAVPFIGDGGTSEGDFHEALNVAAVWNLPVLFVIENNGYGLSTPVSEQFTVPSLAVRAKGYGINGHTVDGNNVLAVYQTVSRLAKRIRKNHKPILLECMTFRRRGHEEASGTKYVPTELMQEWEAKDPVDNYERFLQESEVLSATEIASIRKTLKAEIQHAVDCAFAAPTVSVSYDREISDVYAPFTGQLEQPRPQTTTKEMRYVDAIREGLLLAMERHDDLIIMGQDIAEYGGVFKITEGFVDKFGKDRVRNTPLCESAIIGIAMGLSLGGKKAIVEMQFADFVSCGFNQIVNNLAKNHYRWGHAPQVVIRMPTGGGVGAGPFHSQCNESWFTHTPGLKVVYPATATDAKGLLLTAIDDPNPVLYFEHKYLYRSHAEVTPIDYYHIPLGQAKIIQPGTDVSIVTYGLGVHWAKELLDNWEDNDSIELIDLRTLLPWDQSTVAESVKKTGKCLVLHEDTATGAFGAEIAAYVAESCFEYLDGPVMRVGSLDTPVPFHPELEKQYQGLFRLKQKLEELLRY